MKQIFLAIQDRLSSLVPSLQYIDKNWGQLNLPQPPVKWPCCLIDLDSIDYSQASDLCRLAQANIVITIATQALTRTSAKAPSKSNGYDILDIVGEVINALEGFRVPHTTQSLARTRLAKTYSDQSYDIYSLSFTTAWIEQPQKEGETLQASPSISLRLNLPD